MVANPHISPCDTAVIAGKTNGPLTFHPLVAKTMLHPGKKEAAGWSKMTWLQGQAVGRHTCFQFQSLQKMLE